MAETITLRRAETDHDEFLYALYAESRRAEVEGFGWDREQQDAFLRMQFTARQQAYRMQFPGAEHSIILAGAEAAGRLIVNRTAGQIVLTDIAVMPQFQNRGIGGFVVKQLMDEAAVSGIPLVLRVDIVNTAAIRFYRRLGFVVSSETDLLQEMRWAAE